MMKKEEKKNIVDLEEFSKSGKHIPSGVCYKIRIDREKYLVDDECITGKELLELAGKLPIEKFQINQKLRGGLVKKIGYNEKVDLTTYGIERFMTLPLDQTEG